MRTKKSETIVCSWIIENSDKLTWKSYIYIYIYNPWYNILYMYKVYKPLYWEFISKTARKDSFISELLNNYISHLMYNEFIKFVFLFLFLFVFSAKRLSKLSFHFWTENIFLNAIIYLCILFVLSYILLYYMYNGYHK